MLKKLFRWIRVRNRKRLTLGLIPTLVPLEVKNSPRYVVSLTSYGRRLTATAPYAIITLLGQSVKPDKIVLWVANEDKGRIPEIMGDLTEKGLDIRFCEDIRSYKKLIPALHEFPDDYIITADDDAYYPQNWFEQLMVEHKKNPKKIICHRAHGIKVDENHNPLPYMQWHGCIESGVATSGQSKPLHRLESIFPTGVGGVLYPPKCLHKDVEIKELFMKLAPMADDIWFWAMAILNKEYFCDESPYIVVENGYAKIMQDVEPQQQRKGNSLWSYNLHGGNDKQLKAVIEYYPRIKDVLRKIDPDQ